MTFPSGSVFQLLFGLCQSIKKYPHLLEIIEIHTPWGKILNPVQLWLFKIRLIKLCFACDYYSKIHNCVLENSLKPENVLSTWTTLGKHVQDNTNLCSAICIKHHFFLSHTQNHAYSIVWHSFKYWNAYTK